MTAMISKPTFATDYLRLASEADSAEQKAIQARLGLDVPGVDSDTEALLLRQLYLAQLQMGELGGAVESAQKMVATGALPEVAHHDASRALSAIGDHTGALEHQRIAVRMSPARTRSFHLWSLATLQHFADDSASALGSLEKAARWAKRDAIMIRAQQAYIRLTLDEMPEGLDDLLADLKESRARTGYGGYLLGMIGYHMGDTLLARQELRAFLRRTASADPAKALTLAEELKRARTALARLESD